MKQRFAVSWQTVTDAERYQSMSSAFIKEGDSQQLSEVAPNLTALQSYLRREYGGTMVSPMKTYQSEKYAREVHDMSDGLTYALNEENKWVILLD